MALHLSYTVARTHRKHTHTHAHTPQHDNQHNAVKSVKSGSNRLKKTLNSAEGMCQYLRRTEAPRRILKTTHLFSVLEKTSQNKSFTNTPQHVASNCAVCRWPWGQILSDKRRCHSATAAHGQLSCWHYFDQPQQKITGLGPKNWLVNFGARPKGTKIQTHLNVNEK